MGKRFVIPTTLVIASTGITAPLLADDAKLITFDPPGSHKTYVQSINSRKSVIGFYSGGFSYHGFVRDQH
jgi:hypothetical protein